MAMKDDVISTKTEVAEIKRILIGNGTKGMIRKVEEAMTAILKLESDSKIKIWIYRGLIGVLLMACTWMATQLYNIHFGS